MFIQIIAIVGALLAMDAVWLSSTAAQSRAVFAKLQGQPLEIRWIPAAIVYTLMVVAVWSFAVEPSKSVTEAGTKGAILGATMYGLYDFTNYATLVNYPLWFAAQDTAWGTFLMGTAAAAGFWVR